MTDMIYILAGNASQAANYVRKEGISLHDALYVRSPVVFKVLQDPKYVVTGTFWSRHDATPIWEALVESCTVKPVAPPEIEPFLRGRTPTAPVASSGVTAFLAAVRAIGNPTPPFPILQPLPPEEPEELEPKKKPQFKSIKK